jgi:hypothetical protein
VSQALPTPQPWVVELVERSLQMLMVLLAVALAVLLVALFICIVYVARLACRRCYELLVDPELGASRSHTMTTYARPQ